ncbi:hypothetical protein D3C78_1506370 [compost metagenome]
MEFHLVALAATQILGLDDGKLGAGLALDLLHRVAFAGRHLAGQAVHGRVATLAQAEQAGGLFEHGIRVAVAGFSLGAASHGNLLAMWGSGQPFRLRKASICSAFMPAMAELRSAGARLASVSNLLLGPAVPPGMSERLAGTGGLMPATAARAAARASAWASG